MLYKNLATSLGRLLGYLRTWQNPDGLIGGTIATWWSSTLETAVPHPMNQYPIILGFLALYRSGVDGGDWLCEAKRIGDGLLGSILPDGMLRNCWGDIPGKGTGTVIFAGPALALSELYLASGDCRYFEGAKRLLETIERKWTMRGLNFDGVVNQGFKWAEAMLSFSRSAGLSSYRDRAIWIGRKYLQHQIPKGPASGAFYQSRTDDRLITVYQGKCLGPLIALYEESMDEAFLESAKRLAGYILRQQVNPGLLRNYCWPTGLIRNSLYSALCRTDYRLLRRTVPVFKLWRLIPVSWQYSDYPSFIARSGDTIRGLYMVARQDVSFMQPTFDLLNGLLARQSPHGGFPNTIGFFGNPNRKDWQDVCSPTRWNAYVFQMLCTLMADIDHQPTIYEQPSIDKYAVEVGPTGELVFTESLQQLVLSRGTQAIATLRKPSGDSMFLDAGYTGDLSGPRNTPPDIAL